jgi:hypothetical protein
MGYNSIEKLSAQMNKLETEGKYLVSKAKEAGDSGKMASIICSEMKRKVGANKKGWPIMRPGFQGKTFEGHHLNRPPKIRHHAQSKFCSTQHPNPPQKDYL